MGIITFSSECKNFIDVGPKVTNCSFKILLNFKGEIYPCNDVTAQVLQVVDDVAVGLYVCMLDELCEVLLSNA